MQKNYISEMLKKVYGKNYNVRDAVEKLLGPIGNEERETYDKLLSNMSDKQKELLDKYLRLYCERIFKMQCKRFEAGFQIGLATAKYED